MEPVLGLVEHDAALAFQHVVGNLFAPVRREAMAAEGSLVLQDAPPILKARVDAWGKPGDGFDVMRRLKAEFDPRGLCNPGRFLGGI